MSLTIGEDLVNFYLQEFTVHWFEDHEDAPDDLNDYNELIQGVRRHLRDQNHGWGRWSGVHVYRPWVGKAK